MPQILRVAVLQMATTGDIEENFGKLSAAIEEAANLQAALLVTPECALSGYFPEPDVDYNRIHALISELAQEAARYHLGLALGSAVKENGFIYNRAFLFDRSGRLLGFYDKVALTGYPDGCSDAACFTRGSSFPVFQFEGHTVGLQICFDMRFPENWRILREQGAQLVLHLSNASNGGEWKRPVLAGTIACRAAETGLFIASSNDARPPQMMVSTINDPNGCAMAVAEPDAETMIFADLDLDPEKEWFADGINRGRPVDVWSRPEYAKRLLSTDF